MPAPPDSSQTPSLWQGILAAVAAAFLSLSALLMRHSGKHPRPVNSGQDRSEEILQLLEGLRQSNDALNGKVSHILAVQDNHRDRLITLEVARDNPRGIPRIAG